MYSDVFCRVYNELGWNAYPEVFGQRLLQWLERQGAQGVYIDEALNVVWPLGDTGDNPLTVYMAHSDVVFPDMEPLPLKIEDGKIIVPSFRADLGCMNDIAEEVCRNLGKLCFRLGGARAVFVEQHHERA